MANELQFRHQFKDVALYFVLMNDSNQYWNVHAAPSEWTALGANWSYFATDMTEDVNDYHYTGTIPATLPAGFVTILIYQQIFALKNAQDWKVASIRKYWNGSAFDDLLDIIATAFDTTIPSGPTAGSIYERIEALDDLLGASGDGDVAAIKAKTDNLPSNPAAVGSEMTLEDDAITLSKFDESTAYPLTSADEGASSVVRTGAGEKTILDIFNQIGSAVDDVDSTGEETISLNKAVEIILAVVANNTTYDAVTNTFTIFGRDGSTVLWTVKPSLTVSGTRTESTKA